MKREIVANGVDAVPGVLSQAIDTGTLIFVSGQIPIDSSGELVESDVKDKLSQIMKNITGILNAADLTLDNIVKATIYVTDMSQIAELNKYYPTYFTAPFPAREAVCVAALPLGATIEISVIASR